MAIIFVDQSGKVEKTNKHTVIATSASEKKSYTVMLPSYWKKRICEEIKHYPSAARHRKVPTVKIFSFCVYLAMPYLRKDDSIVIDTEYAGKSNEIKSQLLELIRGKYPEFKKEQITSLQIGKDIYVHKLANETYRGIRKPDKVIDETDLSRLFGKKKN
ncbi:MAG: hypothetical protein NT130_02470 [Candidatus Micrarchaeota archaeon]|nr:hypothetical protein [Candidatus Micrarchaeota archaeon]